MFHEVSISCSFVAQEFLKGRRYSCLRNLLSALEKMQAFTDKMLLTLPDFMASSNARKSDSPRPRPLHVSKSFSKIEPASPDRPTRSQRASTIQHAAAKEMVVSEYASTSMEGSKPIMPPDAFEKTSGDNEDESTAEEVAEKSPLDFDELPIELVSLTDR